MKNISKNQISHEEITQDVDVIIWSIKLEKVRRFFHLRFWKTETHEAEFAKRVETDPRLESVADHSWHVCDTILLIGRHFSELNINKCIKLAILHDKMEIFTGDSKPIGRDGTGRSTYAFDENKQFLKDLSEKEAIKRYLSMLPISARDEQAELLSEMLKCSTNESKFVKAVDKLQALAFIHEKKQGNIDDKHLKFTIDYARKAVIYFPGIESHYKELSTRIIDQVAKKRSKDRLDIENLIWTKQLTLFDL